MWMRPPEVVMVALESALSANLTTVRSALTLYATEHKNKFPGPTADDFKNKLTMYTDIDGNTNAAKSTTFRFGPYLLSIPPCPVGENAGKLSANKVLIDNVNSPPTPNPAGGEGWVYNPTTGELLPNTSQNDDQGNPFSGY